MKYLSITNHIIIVYYNIPQLSIMNIKNHSAIMLNKYCFIRKLNNGNNRIVKYCDIRKSNFDIMYSIVKNYWNKNHNSFHAYKNWIISHQQLKLISIFISSSSNSICQFMSLTQFNNDFIIISFCCVKIIIDIKMSSKYEVLKQLCDIFQTYTFDNISINIDEPILHYLCNINCKEL